MHFDRLQHLSYVTCNLHAYLPGHISTRNLSETSSLCPTILHAPHLTASIIDRYPISSTSHYPTPVKARLVAIAPLESVLDIFGGFVRQHVLPHILISLPLEIGSKDCCVHES